MPFGAAMTGLRGALTRGAGGLGSLSNRLFAAGGTGAAGVARGLGGGLTGAAGLGLGRMARMGTPGLMGTMGAVGGGVYGAFADDTSVVGGAMMGAGLGAGGYGAARVGARGLGAYRGVMAGGSASRRQAAAVAMGAMGGMSRQFIGSSYNRAMNPIKGMYGSIRNRMGL